MKNRPPEPVVFWDIDGTLVSPSLERLFIQYLQDRKLVSPWLMVRRMAAVALRIPLPPWYRVKVAYLRDETPARFDEWVEGCWRDTLESRLLPGAVDAVSRLTDRGVRQVILSGTIEPLARRLAAHLKLNDVIAATPEIRGDTYTGALTEPHPHSMHKVRYAERWLDTEGMSWERAVALADHPDDRYLLRRAGIPVAVNPLPELEKEARRNGWPIATDAELPTLVGSLLSE